MPPGRGQAQYALRVLAKVTAKWPMSRGTSGTWCQARKMRSRIGWELWPGAGQWALITGVHIDGDDVLITIEDGTTFRARYVDAIQCREPAPPEIGDPPSWRPNPGHHSA
jgi:hypothetical protein